MAREHVSQIKNCQEKFATVKDNTFMSTVTWSLRKQYESIKPNLSTSDKQIQTGHANLNELHDWWTCEQPLYRPYDSDIKFS